VSRKGRRRAGLATPRAGDRYRDGHGAEWAVVRTYDDGDTPWVALEAGQLRAVMTHERLAERMERIA
jgi:hypothetical protein